MNFFSSQLSMTNNVTLSPMAVIGLGLCISAFETKNRKCFQRQRYKKLIWSNCRYDGRILVLVYTIFPLVSTIIIQTFHYDDCLEAETGDSYLIEAYSITRADPTHQFFVGWTALLWGPSCVAVLFAQAWRRGYRISTRVRVKNRVATAPTLEGKSTILHKLDEGAFWCMLSMEPRWKT